MKRAEELRSQVIKVVDNVLDEIFGLNLKYIVLMRLEQQYGVKLEDMPENPEMFMEALQIIFGDGALAVERRIVVMLRRESQPEFSSLRYLDEIGAYFRSTKKQG